MKSRNIIRLKLKKKSIPLITLKAQLICKIDLSLSFIFHS